MKVTKSYLRKVILEQLNNIQEAEDVLNKEKPTTLKAYKQLLLRAKQNIQNIINSDMSIKEKEPALTAEGVVNDFLEYIENNEKNYPDQVFAELERKNIEGRLLHTALQFAK